MNLFLWRHAEAEDYARGGDLARALTRKGHHQAEKMATWLAPQLPSDTRIFVSPAARTLETVSALPRPATTVEVLAPDSASLKQILTWLDWPHQAPNILVVGHQPFLGQIAAHLLGMQSPECAVRKGALWWLKQRERNAEMQTILHSVTNPEQL